MHYSFSHGDKADAANVAEGSHAKGRQTGKGFEKREGRGKKKPEKRNCGPASQWTDQEHERFMAALEKFGASDPAVGGEMKNAERNSQHAIAEQVDDRRSRLGKSDEC